MLAVFSTVLACFFAIAYSVCPAGWMQHENNCYKFQKEKENWVNARTQCKWHHSDLMTIETPEEQQWFVTMAKTFNHTDQDDGFWLSGSDWEQEGAWVWEATGAPMTYTVWGPTQPNNRNQSENCLAGMKYFNYEWSDEFCDWDHLQYVCERKLPADPVVG